VYSVQKPVIYVGRLLLACAVMELLRGVRYVSAETLWNQLRAKASLSEFEIHTVPQNKSVPLWFLVGKKDKHLVIKKAKV
jgi:hypothetical protein